MFEEKINVFNMSDSKEKKVNEGHSHFVSTALFIILFLLIAWRLLIVFIYCVNYTDDDQALMWYGTVHFAHGHFPEPCFFGQNYGSMLESLLAVPLYLAGWPLNYALPIVTTLLFLSPFVFCCVWLWKKGKRAYGLLSLLLPVLLGWQCDVITSVPRALISGFPFVVIGIVLLCDNDSKAPAEIVGSVLTAFGCIQSFTAFSIVLISVVCLLFDVKKNHRKIIMAIVSIIMAVIGIALERYFYILNPDYHLQPDPGLAFGFHFFVENLTNIHYLFEDYFAAGKSGILLVPAMMIVVMIFFLKQKRYKELILILCIIVGTIAMLFSDKSTDYLKGSVLYGQARIFLFIPFVILAVYTLIAMDERNKKIIAISEKTTAITTVSFCMLCLIFKGMFFFRAYSDGNSGLYNDSATDAEELVVGVMPVKELMEQTEIINEIALNYGVKAVSLRNGVIADDNTGTVRLPYKSLAYVSSALYYDSPYEFFLPVFDRRTWVYMDMAYSNGGKMLLLKYPVKDANDLMLVELGEDESPVAWFIINHGMRRNTLDYYTGEF